MYFTVLDSPVGQLTIVGDEHLLAAVYMDGQRYRLALDPAWKRDPDRLEEGVRQLGEYFAGTRTRFELEVAPFTGTDFQLRVWRQLREIPFGETRSYRDIAAAIGRPTATRAVGMANGRNPVSVVVPCHRVVGSDGSLTGYGGGIERKRWLLDFEAAADR